MSSKRVQHSPEQRAAGPPPRVWSITGRLTLLYTASAGGLLILASVFLYWVLANNLAREGHRFLADKMHVLGGILRDHPDDRDALAEEAKRKLPRINISRTMCAFWGQEAPHSWRHPVWRMSSRPWYFPRQPGRE